MLATEHQDLIEVDLGKLKPTQITAGFAEVAQKRAEWARLSKKNRRSLIESHWFPAVLGPRERYYIVDHHHLGLALLQEGVERVRLTVLADLSYLVPEIFWRVMEQRNWAHPFDQTGARRGYDAIPTRIPLLVDDAYRSLAGFLRQAGGYAKDTSSFAEFLWADYLRQHITREQIEKSMDTAVREAVGLAKSPLARYLPGWSGVTPANNQGERRAATSIRKKKARTGASARLPGWATSRLRDKQIAGKDHAERPHEKG